MATEHRSYKIGVARHQLNLARGALLTAGALRTGGSATTRSAITAAFAGARVANVAPGTPRSARTASTAQTPLASRPTTDVYADELCERC